MDHIVILSVIAFRWASSTQNTFQIVAMRKGQLAEAADKPSY
jgi:hypothetical protein